MRILSRQIWRSVLSACAATFVFYQQTFIEAKAAQAITEVPTLTRPYPPTYQAFWTGYTEEDWLYALLPDGNTACGSLAVFRGRLPNEQHAEPFFNAPETGGWSAGATCYIDNLPWVSETTWVSCPETQVEDWGIAYYVYEGGFYGKCRLVDNSRTSNEWPNYHDTSLSGVKTIPLPSTTGSPLTTALEIILTPTPLNPNETSEEERTEPKDLEEQIALEAAKNGEGQEIPDLVLKDPKYSNGEWVKKTYFHRRPDGRGIEIHYMENTKTGLREQFKFKNP